MTTPLDRDLAERLERLAAAVPVRPGQLDPVHMGAVRARQNVRMSWLTPLVALAVLVLIAGVVGIGSLNVLNGPISVTTRLGEFTLTLTSAKARYRTGEVVDVRASLLFEGAAAKAQIAHAGSGPLGFGIKEPVQGYSLSPAWRASCGQAQLTRGLPLSKPFSKSGGYDGPDQAGFARFMQEPALALSAGTWHPYVVAEFRLGDCDGERISMRAELAIDVEDQPSPSRPSPTPIPESAAIHVANLDPIVVEVVFRNRVVALLSCGESTVISAAQLDSSSPWHFIVRTVNDQTIDAATLDWHLPAGILIRGGAVLSGPWPMSYGPAFDACSDTEPSPDPTPTPAPTLDKSQTSTDIDGDFEFTFTSDKKAYRPHEPIRIEARLTYRGSSNSVEIGYDTRPISFRIAEKVFGKIQVGGISLLTCGAATLVRDVPLVVPFEKVGPVDNDGPDADELMAWMIDPVLRLPVGTWHITAAASSPCMGLGMTFHVGAQLTIVVRDDA